MMDATEFAASTANIITKSPKISESFIPPVLQFVFGIFGNIIALVALAKSRKKHKWRPFYRFVAGLALTDGGGILLIYPTVFLRYASNFTFEFTKPICNYSSFMFMFMMTSSAMIVCTMSFDRFMAILYPFRYNLIGKKHRANIMLVFIWIISALISSLHLMGFGSNALYYPGSWCFLNFIGHSDLDNASSLIYSLIGLLILFLIIFFNFLVVVALCRKMIKHKDISRKTRKKNNICNVILLLAIVLLFTICWAPIMIIIFGHVTGLVSNDGSLELLVVRLGITNSIVDPWIYILLRKENFILAGQRFGIICLKFSFFSESGSHDITPSSEEPQKRMKNTLSSGKTLSTDDMNIE